MTGTIRLRNMSVKTMLLRPGIPDSIKAIAIVARASRGSNERLKMAARGPSGALRWPAFPEAGRQGGRDAERVMEDQIGRCGASRVRGVGLAGSAPSAAGRRSRRRRVD